MIAWRATYTLGSAFVLGYIALRLWRERNAGDPADKSRGFRPRIGFSQLDGMVSLSLLLANGSEADIWAEEIEIFLSGLKAEKQTAEPSYHGIQKIRQMVGAHDLLPLSLAGVIYKAAGDPQRKYSCVLSSVLRFRIGEEWHEMQMENYRIRMIGLTAASVNRERKPVRPYGPREESPDVPAVAARVK